MLTLSGRVIQCFILIFLSSITAANEQAEWEDPAFAIVYENFASGVYRSGILIFGSGKVYSFELSNLSPHWSLCKSHTISAYEERGMFNRKQRLWMDVVTEKQVASMRKEAERAISTDVDPPKSSGMADGGSMCYLYFEDVPDTIYLKRHLLAVEGTHLLIPSTANGKRVVKWLQDIAQSIFGKISMGN